MHMLLLRDKQDVSDVLVYRWIWWVILETRIQTRKNVIFQIVFFFYSVHFQLIFLMVKSR